MYTCLSNTLKTKTWYIVINTVFKIHLIFYFIYQTSSLYIYIISCLFKTLITILISWLFRSMIHFYVFFSHSSAFYDFFTLLFRAYIFCDISFLAFFCHFVYQFLLIIFCLALSFYSFPLLFLFLTTLTTIFLRITLKVSVTEKQTNKQTNFELKLKLKLKQFWINRTISYND